MAWPLCSTATQFEFIDAVSESCLVICPGQNCIITCFIEKAHKKKSIVNIVDHK